MNENTNEIMNKKINIDVINNKPYYFFLINYNIDLKNIDINNSNISSNIIVLIKSINNIYINNSYNISNFNIEITNFDITNKISPTDDIIIIENFIEVCKMMINENINDKKHLNDINTNNLDKNNVLEDAIFTNDNINKLEKLQNDYLTNKDSPVIKDNLIDETVNIINNITNIYFNEKYNNNDDNSHVMMKLLLSTQQNNIKTIIKHHINNHYDELENMFENSILENNNDINNNNENNDDINNENNGDINK